MRYIRKESLTRILSVDYGSKRIGIAISDLLKIIAKPYKTINNQNNEQVLEAIKKMVEDKKVSKIVVGLPLTLKGQHSEQTLYTLKFVDFLKTNINIDVETYDERLSSIQAKRSLVMQGVKTGHNKGDVDQTAAALFLQGYLDGLSSRL